MSELHFNSGEFGKKIKMLFENYSLDEAEDAADAFQHEAYENLENAADQIKDAVNLITTAEQLKDEGIVDDDTHDQIEAKGSEELDSAEEELSDVHDEFKDKEEEEGNVHLDGEEDPDTEDEMDESHISDMDNPISDRDNPTADNHIEQIIQYINDNSDKFPEIDTNDQEAIEYHAYDLLTRVNDGKQSPYEIGLTGPEWDQDPEIDGEVRPKRFGLDENITVEDPDKITGAQAETPEEKRSNPAGVYEEEAEKKSILDSFDEYMQTQDED